MSLNDHLRKFHLASYERQKSHEPCTLHSSGELALILGGDASALATKDASVRIQELPQDLCILVVDEFDVVLAKIALFLHVDDLIIGLKRYVVRIDLFLRIFDGFARRGSLFIRDTFWHSPFRNRRLGSIRWA